MRDADRLKALSQPYAYPSGNSDAPRRPYQYHSETVLFSSARSGRCLTPDAFDLLLSSYPELVPYIKTGRAFFKEGDIVPDPKEGRSFTGFVVVGAKEREEVKKVAEKVREAWKLDLQ